MNTKLLYTIYAYVHTFTYTISDQKIIHNVYQKVLLGTLKLDAKLCRFLKVIAHLKHTKYVVLMIFVCEYFVVF